MKKTLLSILLLMSAGLTAQAQGFRVYKTDGQVYQFHWAADSIAFFEGEGDPDYQEPVPESVKTALADMQALIDALHKQSLDNRAILQEQITMLKYELDENKARIAQLETQEAEDQEVIATLKTQVEKDRDSITVLNTRVEDYSALVLKQQEDIKALSIDNAINSALNERNEKWLENLTKEYEELITFCKDLQNQIDALKNQ